MSSSARVTPWDFAEAPTEAALRRLMAEEGLDPYVWSNGPGDVYAAHSHTYNKVIYVVRGSIEFGLEESVAAIHELPLRIVLHAGDRLDLAAGVVHDAVVGQDGAVCLEAHRD